MSVGSPRVPPHLGRKSAPPVSGTVQPDPEGTIDVQPCGVLPTDLRELRHGINAPVF